MKKVIKITESNLIQLIKRVISESDSYYDRILDLYNEVGMDGMSEDEIEYLKSGGTTELPKRFQSELEDDELVDADDEHFMVDWMKLEKLKKIVERVPTDFEFPYDNLEKPINLYFVLIFPMRPKLFDFLFNMFGDKPIKANDKNYRPVEIKGNNIRLTIPKTWFEELFSEPS